MNTFCHDYSLIVINEFDLIEIYCRGVRSNITLKRFPNVMLIKFDIRELQIRPSNDYGTPLVGSD